MNHVPMSHEEAITKQMVERFALGELTGEDREKFEAHFFDCQECFDEVRLTSEFLHHARYVLSREPEKSWLARMTADLWRPAPALVSALLLCVVGTAFYQNHKIEMMSRPKLEARYFLDCVDTGQRPFNDGRAGLRIVRMLEATQKSLKRGGEPVSLSSSPPRSSGAVPELLGSID